jgi:hypothetical protein
LHLSWINGFGNVAETESEDEAVEVTKDGFFSWQAHPVMM